MLGHLLRERKREKMRKVRLTRRRLEVIVSALAYWETFIEDGEGHLWETEAEYRQQEHEREQAFIWAHQELAKRNTGRN